MIFINDIPSLRNPDNKDGRNIDDRKTTIPLINGTHIQNGGKTLTGLTIKLNNYSYVDKFESYVSVNFELLKAEYGRSVSFG